ncbi:MAG TPA: UDP-glucose 4-epimerase GalE [Hydrogenophaga sp.]|uniref:UDP-glucose 4-epimerase GalE n=1 Tax=Hydrogenophaga sp. TaxID=1904254 RepID=UPI002B52E708|nr:UDP-glucose 4-epimerase GalE [Hydrogenophaga sp.]HMN93893.1 UDP-glucose 4-epimerase GalE [Hydrogenophaga sp.]HMP11675.1 UDP-glucose 4-epimerase GalE [Hydrogenophaga sp.]
MPKILLTGGAGYIGSHTAVTLQADGLEPIVLDNFSNSHPLVMDRLARITGRSLALERGDVLDTAWLTGVLRRLRPDAIVHFAADKAVGESVAKPLKYFHNNIGGAVSLMRAMTQAGAEGGWERVPALVFSSSATVYGDPASVPITEDFPRSHTNPYGHTKLVIEDMLAAQVAAEPSWRVGVLRYFNPVGAHPSGLIGEDPEGPPNNLMPYVSQVAVGRRPCLQVYGNDYPTPDGTGVRDYIHVMDLAAGHVAAVRRLLQAPHSFTVNLGTGRGHSVLEVVRAFEQVSGQPVPFRFAPRRAGDVAQCWADPSLARELLGWRATRGLQEMCADAWHWQSGNPQGYR